MEREETIPHIKFEYIDEVGIRTLMELDVDFEHTDLSRFDTMLDVYARFLVALTYSADLVKEKLFKEI